MQKSKLPKPKSNRGRPFAVEPLSRRIFFRATDKLVKKIQRLQRGIGYERMPIGIAVRELLERHPE